MHYKIVYILPDSALHVQLLISRNITENLAHFRYQPSHFILFVHALFINAY